MVVSLINLSIMVNELMYKRGRGFNTKGAKESKSQRFIDYDTVAL